MTPKLLPTALILGCTALLAFAFIIPSNTPQTASTAYAQSTPNVSFTQEEVQGKEGSTIYLRVKLDTPVTKTTKVTIKLTPDQGTTSRDIPGLTGTKTVTFYKNGTQTKTVAIRTSRTTAEGDKSLTASITKVGNTTVQGDTARILVKDQKSTGTILTGNQNNTATTTTPTNCAQYEGVIPGETRKLSVQQMQFLPLVVNGAYSLSADAKRDLALLQGDLGFPLSFLGEGPGNSHRMNIPSGTILSRKFKTTEYNASVYYDFATAPHPGTADGILAASVSKCPGDFTSPEVLNNCRSINSTQAGVGFIFGVVPGNQFVCNLDENATYYLNVTSGFSGSGTGSNVPHIGRVGMDGPYLETQTVDALIRPSPNHAFDKVVVKNRSAWYSEIQRISSEWSQSLRRYAGCRRGGGTDASCGGGVLPNPYTFK